MNFQISDIGRGPRSDMRYLDSEVSDIASEMSFWATIRLRSRAPLQTQSQYYLADHDACTVRAERALPSNQVVNTSSPF